MMYTCCEILDEITGLVESMGDKTENGMKISDEEPCGGESSEYL